MIEGDTGTLSLLDLKRCVLGEESALEGCWLLVVLCDFRQLVEFLTDPAQEGEGLEVFGEETLDVMRILSNDEVSKGQIP